MSQRARRKWENIIAVLCWFWQRLSFKYALSLYTDNTGPLLWVCEGDRGVCMYSSVIDKDRFVRLAQSMLPLDTATRWVKGMCHTVTEVKGQCVYLLLMSHLYIHQDVVPTKSSKTSKVTWSQSFCDVAETCWLAQKKWQQLNCFWSIKSQSELFASLLHCQYNLFVFSWAAILPGKWVKKWNKNVILSHSELQCNYNL